MAVHAVVIAGALIAQVLADTALPTPHQPMLFDAASIMPADIRLPPPPRRPPTRVDGSAVSENAAPIVAPTGVIAEAGREGVPLPMPGDTVPGVTTGPPPAIEGVGVQSAVPPPPEPATPIRLHSGMRSPVTVVDVAPVYPAIARSARVQGVVMTVTVSFALQPQ